MKKTSKKLITLILAFVMVFTTFIPATIASAETDIVVGITGEKAKLRTTPSKNAECITTLPSGTLVYISGTKTNSSGNIWYKIEYFGETLYCYSEHIHEHTHIYSIPINNGSCYVCECGEIECGQSIVSRVEPTSITAGIIGTYAGYELAKDLLVLVTGYVGLCKISEYIIPVMINEAGVFKSITMEKLNELVRNNNNTNVPEGENYFAASVILGDTNDSVEIIDFTNPMTKDEACTYIDNILKTKGAFGGFGKFIKSNISACNIYTYDIASAESLCNAIMNCPKNTINSYGNSNGMTTFEMNGGKKINGTYKHFHLINSFDQKSVCHVLFGEPMALLTSDIM